MDSYIMKEHDDIVIHDVTHKYYVQFYDGTHEIVSAINNQDAKAKANQVLFSKIGKHYDELDPEGWYDGELLEIFLNTYIEASPSGKNALVTMGRNIFPILKKTVGLPDFKNPLEAFKFESQTFLMDHKDDEISKVIPREIIKLEDRHVIIKAPVPAKCYDVLLYKGVYLGVLNLFGITAGRVEIIDEENSIFEIKW